MRRHPNCRTFSLVVFAYFTVLLFAQIISICLGCVECRQAYRDDALRRPCGQPCFGKSYDKLGDWARERDLGVSGGGRYTRRMEPNEFRDVTFFVVGFLNDEAVFHVPMFISVRGYNGSQ